MNQVPPLPAELDQRNAYGYPLIPPREQRTPDTQKAYAAGVRASRKSICTCKTCVEMDRLPALQNIIDGWRREL